MITVKQLLESEKRLAHFIDQIESDRGNVPIGAFQFLTTAEDIMQNQRAKLERQQETCWNCRQPLEIVTSPIGGQYCANCGAKQ